MDGGDGVGVNDHQLKYPICALLAGGGGEDDNVLVLAHCAGPI